MPKTKQDLIDLGYIGWPDYPIVRSPDLTHDIVIPDDGIVSDEKYTEATNYIALHGKLTQARDYFSENYQEWPTMTAQQKDQANRQAQRALANICRRLLNDLTTPGD